MPIQFRQWDGYSDARDPNTGTLMGSTYETAWTVFSLLRGRVVGGMTSIGTDGAPAGTGTDSFALILSDGSQVCFAMAEGQPRILIAPAPSATDEREPRRRARRM